MKTFNQKQKNVVFVMGKMGGESRKEEEYRQ